MQIQSFIETLENAMKNLKYTRKGGKRQRFSKQLAKVFISTIQFFHLKIRAEPLVLDARLEESLFVLVYLFDNACNESGIQAFITTANIFKETLIQLFEQNKRLQEQINKLLFENLELKAKIETLEKAIKDQDLEEVVEDTATLSLGNFNCSLCEYPCALLLLVVLL